MEKNSKWTITVPQREKAPPPGDDPVFDEFIEEWCEWEPEDRDGWWHEWTAPEFFEGKQESEKQNYLRTFERERGDRQEERAKRAENDVNSLKRAAAELRQKYEEK